jgi:hypothetical protein
MAQVERGVGQEPAARRPEDARHDARAPHRHGDEISALRARAFEQAKDGDAVGRVLRPDGQLEDARGRRSHLLVNLFEVRGDAAEVVVRADDAAPVQEFSALFLLPLAEEEREV